MIFPSLTGASKSLQNQTGRESLSKRHPVEVIVMLQSDLVSLRLVCSKGDEQRGVLKRFCNRLFLYLCLQKAAYMQNSQASTVDDSDTIPNSQARSSRRKVSQSIPYNIPLADVPGL